MEYIVFTNYTATCTKTKKCMKMNMILPFFVEIQRPSPLLKDLCFKNWFEIPCDIFLIAIFCSFSRILLMYAKGFHGGINLNVE